MIINMTNDLPRRGSPRQDQATTTRKSEIKWVSK